MATLVITQGSNDVAALQVQLAAAQAALDAIAASVAALEGAEAPPGLPGANTLMYDEALACGTNTTAAKDSFSIGTNTAAAGVGSLASGVGSTASGDGCRVGGTNSVAGYPPLACTIAGVTVTIPGVDISNDFYDGSPLALTSLTGGTGPTAVLGVIASDPYGVDYVAPDTILTLVEAVTDHTAGKVAMTDMVSNADAFGNTAVATAGGSIARGTGTLASGPNSDAGGSYTAATADSAISRGRSSLASLPSQFAFSSGPFLGMPEGTELGSSQGSILSGRTSTSSATPRRLKINDFTDFAVRADRTLGFTVRVTARKTADGTVGARFVRSGLIANNAGTTALIGAVTTVGTDVNASGLAVAVTADDADDALAITVTGLASTTIKWTAVVEWEEVG
jgi:trimeric autotransporter adhesin